jgi:hypothetical protein
LRDDIASEPCRGPTSARTQRGDASDRWLPASARDGLSVAANLATKGDGTRTRASFLLFFLAVQVPASRKGAKQSARISEPEMHPSVQQKALLWVPFLTDFFWRPKIYDKDWSVKKIYERIDDLSV